MKVIIAAGGTGGHIFPGVAVAEALKAKVLNIRIAFVGTRQGMENQVLPDLDLPLFHIRARGLKRTGYLSRLVGLVEMPISFMQALRILHSYEPDVVIGMGGYVSGIVCLTAKLMGFPVFIQEQNTHPGLTNRVLGKFADKVFIAFKESAQYFQQGKTLYTGNPIRKAIVNLKTSPISLERNTLKLFVGGGSQGARSINNAFLEALPLCKEKGVTFDVRHQTGALDFEDVNKAYQESGFKADVRPFFDDMADVYQHCDLIIGRSGAGILEFAACGRPSILIPYPYAADDHQRDNARVFAEANAAVVIDPKELTGAKLAEVLLTLQQSRERLRKMGKAAEGLSKRDAADKIADACIDVTKEKKRLLNNAEASA